MFDFDYFFVIKFEEWLERCWNILFFDFGYVVVEVKKVGVKGYDRFFKYMGIYGIIDVYVEVVKVFCNG